MSTGDYMMPFGKYRGQTLSEIADSDEGVRYLDWLRGERGDEDNVGAAIAAFLDDPVRRHRIGGILS